MPDPTTGILDAFNRANGAAGANWTNDTIGAGSTGLFVNSNQLVTFPGGSYGEGFWNPSTFGPNSEVYSTVATLPSGSGACFGFTNRIQSPGSAAADGYRFQTLGNDISLIEVFNGGESVMGATISHTLAVGDSFWFPIDGGTLYAYKKASGGGTYSLLDSRSDGTYSSAGNIGFWAFDPGGAGRWDDLGGGTIVPAAGSTVKHLAALGVG